MQTTAKNAMAAYGHRMRMINAAFDTYQAVQNLVWSPQTLCALPWRFSAPQSPFGDFVDVPADCHQRG